MAQLCRAGADPDRAIKHCFALGAWPRPLPRGLTYANALQNARKGEYQHYFYGDQGEPTTTGWYPVDDKVWTDVGTAVTYAVPGCSIPLFPKAKRAKHGLHR